jgi:multiple sugar transport system substrate-binding protein
MRHSKHSRRHVATIAAVLAGALGLAACGTGQSPTGEATLSDGDVTLRLNWWGADARHERTQAALDLFEEKYPNIDVVGEFSDWQGYWDKLATSTAGGNAPDVLQMDQLYLASYADRGTLADLDALPQLDTSDLDSSVVDAGRSQGTLYGMPISNAAMSVLVNQDVLDELGLTLPDTDTWTWEEFGEFASSVTEASGGAVAGVAPWTNEYSLQLFARQQGEALFTDGDISISPETLAAYFEMALGWVQSGAAPSASKLAEQAGVPLDQTYLSTGEVAMIFQSVTMISAFTTASGGANLVAVNLPTEDANDEPFAYLKPGMYWSVSARSAHPAEAALLVDFLVNDPEAGALLGTERGIPANPVVRDSLTGDLGPDETKAFDYVTALEPLLGDAPEIVPNGASEIDASIARYVDEVLFLNRTPAEAADALIAEIQSSIASA